jgi:hypothetical protein
MQLAVCLSLCLKGFSTPTYKGAWRGHHGGTGADTIWSPTLSLIQCRVLQGNPPWACLRIRHKLLRPVPAMGFPVPGPPSRQSAIPPPWATLACWFKTTSLVYLFGISPRGSFLGGNIGGVDVSITAREILPEATFARSRKLLSLNSHPCMELTTSRMGWTASIS